MYVPDHYHVQQIKYLPDFFAFLTNTVYNKYFINLVDLVSDHYHA